MRTHSGRPEKTHVELSGADRRLERCIYKLRPISGYRRERKEAANSSFSVLSSEHSPASTHPLKLWDDKLLLFKLLSSWYFDMTVTGKLRQLLSNILIFIYDLKITTEENFLLFNFSSLQFWFLGVRREEWEQI